MIVGFRKCSSKFRDLLPSTNKCSHLQHHHQTVLMEQSPVLFCHLSFSFITLGRYSRQHPVSIKSYRVSIFTGQPTLVCPCVGVHSRTLLMSSSLFLQPCSARVGFFFFEICGKCTYNCCFVGCCLQDLFKTAQSILV